MGMLGLTTVGATANIIASLYASYRAHTAHVNAHRPPAPAPAAGHPAVPPPPTEAPSTSAAPETASAQTSQSSTEHATLPQATATPPATSSGTPSTSPSTDLNTHTEITSPSAHNPSPPHPTFDAFNKEMIAEMVLELEEFRHHTSTAPQGSRTPPTPSPFRGLNGQIICEPATGRHLDLHLSWTDSNNQHQTRHVQCTSPQVIEVPHDARNITMDWNNQNVSSDRLLWARIQPGGYQTDGWPDRFNITHRILDLVSSLRQSHEWPALQEVTRHILEQASSEAPPEFMAQMEALNHEASLHIDAQNAHAAALAGMGMAAVGVAGAYTAYQLYRGYQQGRRGWDLFLHPLHQAADSLGLLPPPEYEVLPLIEMEEVRVDVPEQEPAHVEAPAAAPPPPPPPPPIDDDEGFGEEDELDIFAQQRVQQWLQQQHHPLLVAEAPEQNNDDNEHSSDED